LETAYAIDQILEAASESVTKDTTDFDLAWKSLGATYSKLHEFFGGLATVFPGAPSAELHFSYLKMTSGKHSTNLTDFSLEEQAACEAVLQVAKDQIKLLVVLVAFTFRLLLLAQTKVLLHNGALRFSGPKQLRQTLLFCQLTHINILSKTITLS
jgi:hypothetical protein